jgi:uncharacterized repeat protein (TIGR04138 family)
MPAPHALDQVRQQIIEPQRDDRYRLEGYNFVLNGLEFYLMKIGEKRHVSGQELSRGLAQFALRQFGALTLEVLNHWGIRKSDDLGNIVYNLIAIGLMSRQPQDRLEDFCNVFDFEEIMRDFDPFTIDTNHIKSIKGA